MAEKEITLRKVIDNVEYDVMPKTTSDQVYINPKKTLTMALDELDAENIESIEARVDQLEASAGALKTVENADKLNAIIGTETAQPGMIVYVKSDTDGSPSYYTLNESGTEFLKLSTVLTSDMETSIYTEDENGCYLELL